MNDQPENPGRPSGESPTEIDPKSPLETCAEAEADIRLYIPEHGDWDARIKRDSERVYCYAKLPGEDWFHLILNGEIYLARQHERYCLRCALRLQFLTHDRLFWQHRVPKRPPRVL